MICSTRYAFGTTSSASLCSAPSPQGEGFGFVRGDGGGRAWKPAPTGLIKPRESDRRGRRSLRDRSNGQEKGVAESHPLGVILNYLQYLLNQAAISSRRESLFCGLPERESSWFSPWKRHILVGTPLRLRTLNIWIGSLIQQR